MHSRLEKKTTVTLIFQIKTNPMEYLSCSVKSNDFIAKKLSANMGRKVEKKKNIEYIQFTLIHTYSTFDLQ